MPKFGLVFLRSLRSLDLYPYRRWIYSTEGGLRRFAPQDDERGCLEFWSFSNLNFEFVYHTALELDIIRH